MQLLKYGICTFLLFAVTSSAAAQGFCDINGVKGQTPASAFPVCGTTVFTKDTVPDCINYPFPAPGCPLIGVGDYKDKNPFWYTFTCYSSGSLAFLIDPKNAEDNYNWQFYDITGHGASEIYSDGALVRAANWSGSPGKTGASSSGANIRECASVPGDNVSTFSKMPDIIEGHTYLLMVSHFNDGTESGFTLSFNGGSASINNPATPALVSATISCDYTQIGLKLTKKMTCSSIAADGSDFEIQGLNVPINSAVGIGCNTGFSTDSVNINLSSPLPPGSYTLAVKKGSDNNTLLDNCGNAVEPGNSTIFNVLARQPVALDSITTPYCAPNTLQLVFKKNIRCGSVAADGSDFTITGPYPVTVIAAKGNCNNDATNVIKLQLLAPMVHEGKYTVTLLKGTDGNAITDQCGLETPAGSSISFSVKDTVSAAFTYQLTEGCRYDTIHYFNALQNGKINWNWQFDNAISTSQNPTVVYSSFGNKTTQLTVSNGFCRDTAVVNFYLNHDSLHAAFTMPSVYCPNELVYFKDSSLGNIINWYWQFGNGLTSTFQSPPPQVYTPPGIDRLIPVQLIVQSNKACYDTVIKYLKVVNSCYIAVPNAFTPNMDGHNDYLYPLNAYRTSDLEFKIFNKFGQQLFSTKDWTRKWNGTFNDMEQPPGVYVWFLRYTNTDTGKTIFKKGTTVLIR